MYHALIEDVKWKTLQKLRMMKNNILPLKEHTEKIITLRNHREKDKYHKDVRRDGEHRKLEVKDRSIISVERHESFR